MINLGDGVYRFFGNTKGVDKALSDVEKKAKRSGKKAAKGFGGPLGAALKGIKSLALTVGAAFGALAIVKIFKDMTSAAIDFEKAFANVSTLIDTRTPQGVAQLENLRKEILDLDPALGSATELTEGLYQALSAGVKPAQAVKLVAEAALFAKAGLTSTSVAVDVLTTIMNAYGKSADEANEISSVLFATVQDGKTTAEQLATSLGKAIPNAVALGIEITELNAAIATLTLGGFKTSEAVTALQQVMKSVIKPTEKSREALAAAGLTAADLRDVIAKDGLVGALKILGEITGGNIEKAGEFFESQEALNGVLALTGKQAGDFARIIEDLEAAQADGNVTARAAEKIFATFGEQVAIAGRKIQTEFIKSFNEEFTPALQSALLVMGDISGGTDSLRIILNLTARALTFVVQGWQSLVFILLGAKAGVLEIQLVIEKLIERFPTLAKVMGITGNGVEKTVERLNSTVDSLLKVKERILDLKEVQAELKRQADESAKSLGDLGKANDDVADKTDKNSDSQRELRDRYEKVRDSVNDLLRIKSKLPPAIEREIRATKRIIERLREEREEREALASTISRGQLDIRTLGGPGPQAIETINEMERATIKANDAMQDYAHTIGQAFEDAILGGKGFREVLKGLFQDITRIALRVAVTIPLQNFFTKIFGGVKLPGFAGGGRPPVGFPVEVGEKGRELFVPDVPGTIVSNADLKRGAGNVTIINQIDARGADPGIEFRVAAMFKRFQQQAVAQSLATLADARLRGGG
ncbi:hypothetical protein LCGC14_0630200 [marine sediment metagenome]|uniref:Phage tail tape measure protein domain-containing protein n=1 Tax=marine sediment metagenome TaxID=412755 RepID=A0A0F9TNI7_9ZZZZ